MTNAGNMAFRGPQTREYDIDISKWAAVTVQAREKSSLQKQLESFVVLDETFG